MSVPVIKASGRTEEFRTEKLVESLVRSGADPVIALEIALQVEKQLAPSYHTRHIYRLARRLLRKHSRVFGMRYSLKRALALLGPSGYPFEKYFARILVEHGFTAETNRIVGGRCIEHEVDILASKDGKGFVIECKYHTDGGKATDVKTALYVRARFLDIRKSCSGGTAVSQGWLVTNTRCTAEAIKYAECSGLRIVSWRYPSKDSLEDMIETKRLYPVTILPSIRRDALDTLYRNGIILARDVAEMDIETLTLRSGLDTSSARAMKKQADELCVRLDRSMLSPTT